jgi:TonB-linked SusC/RagA family outer membrane protein
MKKKTILLLLLVAGFLPLVAQNIQVRGSVKDAAGTPLQGVTITERNADSRTQTDAQGNFTITVKNRSTSLIFSSVGFKTQTVAVDGNSPVSVALDKDVADLDEVIVIGYGTTRKKDLTGSVISVKGDEIKKVPASNAMEALQGKLPGVDIVRTSGGAGANVSVTIRGNRSISATNSPLYIVDGIQYSNYQDINPNDIQSMEVMKDASSTAIYGSRGANGVILITTKRGTAGKVKVSANSYYGVSELAGYPKPMTGPQYADLRRQAFRTAGTWNSTADDSKVFTNPADLAAVQRGDSYYWPGMLLGKGSQQEYGVGVSGGTDKTKVYFSFNYFKEEGLLNNDYSNRYTLRLNIDQSITDNFKVGLQSQLAYYDQNLRSDGILNVANKVIPYFNPYNPDGSIPKFPGNGNQVNPLLEEEPGAYINDFKITRLLSTAYAEWKPLEGLVIRSNLGLSNSNIRNGSFQGANTIARALSTGSISGISNQSDMDLTWENIITWQKRYNKHAVGLTGVTSYLSNRREASSASGTGQLLASQSFYSLQNNPSNLAISSNYVGSNLVSGTFRLNYSYDDKYLLTFTGRADGSSVLAEQNKWSFFPSVAAAWRVIQEGFMQSQNTFSDLKLRISYGVAGTSAVRPYQTQSGLALVPFSWNDQSTLAYTLDPQIGNPDLKWELTATQNIGLDFGFLKNRITGSVDFYDSRTSDLLLLRQLPASTGGQNIQDNVGKTRNTGFEIDLRTLNIQSKNFTWSSAINYTRNNERIVSLPNEVNDIASGLFIGYPVSAFYDYRKEGIWQTSEATAATAFGNKPGDIKVSDIDGDKKFSAAGDRIVLGSAVPKYSVGFTNDLKFKNFDMNIQVFARVGQMFISQYANKFEPNAIENGANVDYWTPENATNDYPRPNSNISRAALPFATTLGYKDGSFLKIRNISLGYTLPSDVTRKWHISSLRFYVSARNYLTFSKMDDYDPEGAGSFERPLTKLIVTGLNIEF